MLGCMKDASADPEEEKVEDQPKGGLPKIYEGADAKKKSRVGVCYDAFCKKHMEGVGHVEAPNRISAIHNYFTKQKLWECFTEVKTRLATKEEIGWVHDAKHLERLWVEMQKPFTNRDVRQFDSDTQYTKDSFTCVLKSCGGMLAMTEQVLTDKLDSGCCVLRPPGHHAECSRCMGFCYVNNVAVAAELAKRKFGLKRIVILDWDVHWGNATQRMFYDDPTVFYISQHRYDNGGFYPGDRNADELHIGEKEGIGYNMNMPLVKDIGDKHFMAMTDMLIAPVLSEWKPELIIISAGFDSAKDDPLGGLTVTEPGYSYMTETLKLICPKVICCLEGGYNVKTIPIMYYAAAQSLLLNVPRFEKREHYIVASESEYPKVEAARFCQVSEDQRDDVENDAAIDAAKKKGGQDGSDSDDVGGAWTKDADGKWAPPDVGGLDVKLHKEGEHSCVRRMKRLVKKMKAEAPWKCFKEMDPDAFIQEFAKKFCVQAVDQKLLLDNAPEPKSNDCLLM